MSRNIWIDIDDTICDYTSSSLTYEQAIPNNRRIDIVNKMYDQGHHITLWTGRGTLSGIDWYSLTKQQVDSWGVKYHELKMGKPAFDILVDDKALTNLEQLVNKLNY